MPDSPEVVRALMQCNEVFITTAAMDVPKSFNAKFHWLQRHFPFIPRATSSSARQKHYCGGLLIDDNIRQLGNFRGEGIIYTAPHNIHEPRFRRVGTWRDVAEMFLD